MTDNQIEVSSLQHQFISKYSSDNIRKSLNLSKKISNQNRHSDSEAKYYYDLGIEKLDLADILCDPDTRDNDCHKGCLFYIEAIDYFTQAIAINPLCAEFYLKRGHAEHSLIIWQPSTAHSCLEFWDAIANNLENINLRADLERKATEDINQALKINPQYIDAYLERTYFNYINLGYDTDSVISDINQVLAMNIDTHNINTYLKLAEIKSICLDDYIGAILDYSQIIALDPKNITAYLKRAWARSTINFKDYNGAILDYSQIIAIDPKNIDAYMGLAYAKAHYYKDYIGALLDLSQIITIDPRDIRAYRDRAEFRSKYLNDYKGAISDYSKIITIDPKNIDAYKSRAYAKNYHYKDYIGAILDYSQIITIDPKNIDAYLRIAEFRFAMGNYQELIKDCDLGISIAEARISNCNYIKTNICRVEDLLGRLNDLLSKGLEKL